MKNKHPVVSGSSSTLTAARECLVFRFSLFRLINTTPVPCCPDFRGAHFAFNSADLSSCRKGSCVKNCSKEWIWHLLIEKSMDEFWQSPRTFEVRQRQGSLQAFPLLLSAHGWGYFQSLQADHIWRGLWWLHLEPSEASTPLLFVSSGQHAAKRLQKETKDKTSS